MIKREKKVVRRICIKRIGLLILCAGMLFGSIEVQASERIRVKELTRQEEEYKREEDKKRQARKKREELTIEAEELHQKKKEMQRQKMLSLVEISDKKRVYPVREGDTLKKIAAEVYGDEDCWNLIYEANTELLSGEDEEPKEGIYLILPENGEKLTWDDIYAGKEDGAEMDIFRAEIAENVPYRIEEYYYYKNEKDSVYGKWETEQGRFNVTYPQLVFEDGRDAALINASIRDCAMYMVDRLYLHPTDAIQELFEDPGYKKDMRISEVFYQITYMDENVISIVFQDAYYMGNIFTESYEMRSIIVDVKTGQVYTGADLFENREQLAIKVHDRIQARYVDDESCYNSFDGEMDEALFLRLLEEEGLLEGRYRGVLFLAKDGIYLGISFRSNYDGLIWRGYEVTCFTEEELSEYYSESAFWKER